MELLGLLTKPCKYDIEVEDNLKDNFYDGYGYFAPGYIKVAKATFKFDIIDIIEKYIKEKTPELTKDIDIKGNLLYYTYYINKDEIVIEYKKDLKIYILYFHHETSLYNEYKESKLEKLI